MTAGSNRRPDLEYNFSVANPTILARGPEVVWVEIPVPQGELFDHTRVSLFERGTSRELYVACLDGDVSYHPDGSIHRMKVHFQDRWDPWETRDYTAVIGRSPAVTMSRLMVTTQGEWVIVSDPQVEYQVHIDDAVWPALQYNPGLYYVYIVNQPSRQVRATSSILTRIGGNQLDPDQASFQMWWGRHTSLTYEYSRLVARVHLTYEQPQIIHWGPSGATVQQILREPDIVRAEVTLTFYNGIHRVDVESRKVINERFWNHNGFVMEFTSILGNGAEWEGEYETVFGTDRHMVMTTTTQGPTWTRVSTAWQDVDVGTDAAPALWDLDADGDLDMMVGSEDAGIVAFQNTGTVAEANMTENATWASGLPAHTSITPALGDLDADGDADMVLGNDLGYLQVYRNTGGASGPPAWERWWGHFDRLAIPSHTAPALGDPDGDGDLDIVLGLADGTMRGAVNTGSPTSPSWTLDHRWVQHLSWGPRRAPTDAHSVPHMADFDRDGDVDLLIGSDDGKVTYFENTGDARMVRWDRLDLALFAGIATASAWEGNSTPVLADVDGDGDRDLLVGNHQGTLHLYRFDGNTTPYRGHVNLQPLQNGTYRHMRDKDGNDGCFVVEGYGHEWYGYYVLTNPRNGYTVLRYLPDWDRLAYKQEYYGDIFPAAGGNVSYYPYDPVAQEYVTRAQITSNCFENGVSAGTFISQTGTSAGFVMQPMTAMVYDSREVLLLDLTRQVDPAAYNDYIGHLANPLGVTHEAVDLVVDAIELDPPAPSDGEPASLSFRVVNINGEATKNVRIVAEAIIGEGAGQRVQVIEDEVKNLAATYTYSISPIDNWGWRGNVTIRVIVDVDGNVTESDEANNVGEHSFAALPTSLPWSDPVAVTRSVNSSLDADAIVTPDGDLLVVWETCQGREEIDIEGRWLNLSSGTWGPVEALVTGSHYAVEPDLAVDEDGIVHMAYSSNIRALQYYYQTAHAKYYWGEKFDLWGTQWDAGTWQQPRRWTDAADYDHSDQAPAIVLVGGFMHEFFRHTRFEFYTGGNQMNNVPFQEMDVRRDWSGQGTHERNLTVSVTAGSQAWWGGPDAAPWGDEGAWVVYASEVGNSQWDLYAEAFQGDSSVGLVRLSNTNSIDEVRPSIALGGTDPELVVAYETTRRGNRDIAVRMRAASSNPAQGWGPETVITDDPTSDMKPSAVYDGQGNYWVAWETYRAGNKDILISRFDGTEWHGPYQVTTHPGSDEDVVLACDQRTGRVYVVWETDRNGMGNKDIYMRMLEPRAPRLALETTEPWTEDEEGLVTGTLEDADGDGHRVEWDWGDGTSSITRWASAGHAYRLAGNYTIQAQAFDRFGLGSPVWMHTVEVVNPSPNATLEGDVDVAEDEVAVLSAWRTTDNPSDMASLTIEWDFGDGTGQGPLSLGEAMNVTHTWTSSGTYTVSITVADDDHAVGSAELVVTVRNLPPMATAWTRFDVLEEDEEGDFAGSAEDTPSDTMRGFEYRWEWGDGTESEVLADPVIAHSYPKSGRYVATLYVYDDDGDVGTAQVNVTVVNVAPSVTVTGGTVAVEDEEVTVTAEGADTPSDGPDLEYHFDWGDGTTRPWSTNATATHPYTAEGNYVVTVRVRDDDGDEAQASFGVTVSNAAPVARASASATTVAEGVTIRLSANGTTDTPSDMAGLVYRWDLGTEVVDAFEVDHAFQHSGVYTVRLTVIDDQDERSSAMLDIIVVNRPPSASGWLGPLETRVGKVVRFDATNSSDDPWDEGGLSFRWSMGDGTELLMVAGQHAYQLPGEYQVALRVYDEDGDVGEWTTAVRVLPAAEDDGGGDGGIGSAWIFGLVALLLVALLIAYLYVHRRGGPIAEEMAGGGEGPTGEEEAQEGGPGTSKDVDPQDLLRSIDEDLERAKGK